MTGICHSSDVEAMEGDSDPTERLLEGHVDSVPRTVGTVGSLNSGDDDQAAVFPPPSPVIGHPLFASAGAQQGRPSGEDAVIDVDSVFLKGLPEVSPDLLAAEAPSEDLDQDGLAAELQKLANFSGYVMVKYAEEKDRPDLKEKHGIQETTAQSFEEAYASVDEAQGQLDLYLAEEGYIAATDGPLPSALGDLVDDNSRLREEKGQFQEVVTTMQVNYEHDVRHLKGVLGVLKGQHTALKAQHAACAPRIEELSSQNDTLNDQVKTLTSRGCRKNWVIATFCTTTLALAGVLIWKFFIAKNH